MDLDDKFWAEADAIWASMVDEETLLKSYAVSSRAELPDAAFAVIDRSKVTGKEDGKSKPDSARHLPHHSKSVKNGSENSTVVISLLRNALARMNQIGASAALKAKAKSHLVAHAKALLPNSQFVKGADVSDPEDDEEEPSSSPTTPTIVDDRPLDPKNPTGEGPPQNNSPTTQDDWTGKS